MYALIKNGAVEQYPYAINDLKEANPNTSFPAQLSPSDLAAYGVAIVVVKGQPAYDPLTQSVIEAQPAYNAAKQQWEQQWSIVALTADQRATRLAADAAAVAAKQDALWRAADAYTSGFISGVAVGLLTIGVIQGKPKALAVTAWSSSVWDAYYQRKALVTATSVDDHDFAGLGPIPHSVPDLRAELGM